MSLLEWLTELTQGNIYFLDDWFVLKGAGQGHGAPRLSPSAPLSPNRHVFTTPEALQTPTFQAFMEEPFQ